MVYIPPCSRVYWKRYIRISFSYTIIDVFVSGRDTRRFPLRLITQLEEIFAANTGAHASPGDPRSLAAALTEHVSDHEHLLEREAHQEAQRSEHGERVAERRHDAGDAPQDVG